MTTNSDESILYTISEAAKLSGLPESTLRYYEKIGIIKSIRRDNSSKHRTYSEDDLNIITAIACLNATGMSLKEMKQYLNNLTLDENIAPKQLELLNKQRQRLENESYYLQLKKRYVDLKINYWKAIDAGDLDKAKTIGNQAKLIASEL